MASVLGGCRWVGSSTIGGASSPCPASTTCPTPADLEKQRRFLSRGLLAHGVEKADDLERLVALHGAETIAAVIVEPVASSTGVLPPPVGYLERLRALCDRHGLLLIFDEVITGFGRLGAPFAAPYFGVTPDLMTTAKAITNAAVPMGAVALSGAGSTTP